MKTKLTQQIFAALCAIAIISSCTIEKRRYTDGYHIEGLGHNKKVQKAEPVVIETPTAMENTATEEKTEAVVENTPIIVQEPLAVLAEQPTSNEAETAKNVATKSIDKKVLRQEIKAARKTARAEEIKVPSQINQGAINSPQNDTDSSDGDAILLIILALFIPPLAVFLFQGSWDGVCWLNLILTLLFFLPGVVHAILVILEVI